MSLEEPAADTEGTAGTGLRNPELFVLCDPDYSGLGVRRLLFLPGATKGLPALLCPELRGGTVRAPMYALPRAS